MLMEINDEIGIDDEFSKDFVDFGLRRVLVFIIRNVSKMKDEKIKSIPVFINDIFKTLR